MNGNTNVRYEGIADVIKKLDRIGEDNLNIGKIFKETIDSFKNNKSLSSKVITPSMEQMINEIDKINMDFKNSCLKYAEFLNIDVNKRYDDTDEESRKIWNEISEIYDKARM